jgi:hypothetical protein
MDGCLYVTKFDCFCCGICGVIEVIRSKFGVCLKSESGRLEFNQKNRFFYFFFKRKKSME